MRVYHIDGTHKFVKQRYVLIVFGSSDINGHLHLISLSIFSHETEEDFKYFYLKLIELCSMLNILFIPSFIMQDGCSASHNAAEEVFIKSGISPYLIILMCWFHVKFNVKKRLNGNPYFEMVMKDIDKLHYCKNSENMKY